MLYDGILLFGLLFLALALVAIPAKSLWGIELSGQSLAVRIYLLLVAAAFHIWFWTHGGRTLGMQAWRLRLVTDRGEPVGLAAATLRYLVAILSLGLLGLGFWWSLVDPERRTWHDIASRTRLVRQMQT